MGKLLCGLNQAAEHELFLSEVFCCCMKTARHEEKKEVAVKRRGVR
jgi:hypothetical protein